GYDLTGSVERTGKWEIGSGASTVVWEGAYRRTQGDTLVAIKIFREPRNEEERSAFARRLIRESDVWCQLSHNHIQPYLGWAFIGPTTTSIGLISPLCHEGTVDAYLSRNPHSDRQRLVRHVARGLDYLHRKNIIHGDLKT
ncbi:hypothetical protein JAAARDRAFT_155821, partial [Jaapia argillacea MUCL 33604]